MKPPIRKYKRLQTLLIRLVVILLLTFAVTGGMTLHPLAATAEGSPPNQGVPVSMQPSDVVITEAPTAVPTPEPTDVPTAVPTAVPTPEPTVVPTAVPTPEPTDVPTAVPTAVPTDIPTLAPTAVPTAVPIDPPSDEPAPTETFDEGNTSSPRSMAAATLMLIETDADPGTQSSQAPSTEPLAESTEGPDEGSMDEPQTTPIESLINETTETPVPDPDLTSLPSEEGDLMPFEAPEALSMMRMMAPMGSTESGDMVLMGAAATPTPAPIPDPIIPGGKAYLYLSETDDESTRTTYLSSAVANAVQQAVDAALASAASSKVRIVVEDGVYEGGLQIIKPAQDDSSTVPTGFELDIRAHDAGDNNVSSAGNVQLFGNVNIDSINTALAGLYLSLQSIIKAKNADIEVYGTETADNIQVEATGAGVAGTVKVDTGAGDDIIQADTEAVKSVTILGGDGHDDIDVSYVQAPTVTLEMEADNRESPSFTADAPALVSQAIAAVTSQANGTLTVDAGKGDDTVTVEVVNSTGLSVSTGADATDPSGAPRVYGKAQVDLGATNVTVSGGEGADKITASGGMQSVTPVGQTLVGALVSAVESVIGSSSGTVDKKGSVNVKGGAGDDTVTVDTAALFSSFRGVDISVDGETGFDKLHLKGSIDGADGLSGTAEAIALKAKADISLFGMLPISRSSVEGTIANTGMEAYTDTLKGKNEVALGSSQTVIALQPFTNYILPKVDGVLNRSFTFTGTNSFLSNIVYDVTNDAVIAGSEHAVVGTLDAQQLNVLILGREIDITGLVRGRNITVKAKDDDSHELKIVDNDLNDEGGLSVELSFMDFSTDARLTVASTASLIASETIDLSVESRQTKPLIPTFEELLGKFGEEFKNRLDFNPISVKVGSAKADLAGTYSAGGFMHANASSVIKQKADNTSLANLFMPLAVGVIVTDAKVVLHDAAITAGTSGQGGVKLTSDSLVKLNTHAATGVLPIALAVSVAVTDASVLVGDNVNIAAAHGDVSLRAKGLAAVKTSADRGAPLTAASPAPGATPAPQKQPSKSGGFFAISVVLQDIASRVAGRTSITGEDVSVEALAREEVINKATSDDSGNGEQKSSYSLASVVSFVKGLLGFSSNQTGSSNPQGSAAMNRANNAVEGTPSDDEDLGLGDLFSEPDSNNNEEDMGLNRLFDESTSGAAASPAPNATPTPGSTPAPSAKSSNNQLVGALAVTFGSNKAYADINVSDESVITSLGTVRVASVANMVSLADADASPITTQSAGAGTGTPSDPNVVKDEVHPAVSDATAKVNIAATTNGTVTLVSRMVVSDDATQDEIKFRVVPRDGFEIGTVTPASAVNYGTGVYHFNAPAGQASNIGATFTAKPVKITFDTAKFTGGEVRANVPYAKAGETITIKVTPGEGSTRVEAAILTIGGVNQTGASPYTYVVPASATGDLTVSATANLFEKTPYTVAPLTQTDSVATRGSVSYTNTTGTNTAHQGDNVLLSVTASQGWYLEILKYKNTVTGVETIIPNNAGQYHFTMPAGNVQLIGSFKEGAAPASTAKGAGRDVALGVGIAVDIAKNKSIASIRGGQINADALTISALSPVYTAVSLAKAGFSATPPKDAGQPANPTNGKTANGSIGVAGAVSVQVVGGKTLTTLGEKARLTVGSGNLTLNASGQGLYAAVADAGSKAKSGGEVGIGAAIAVQVAGIDVVSGVDTSIPIINKAGTQAGAFAVTSAFKGKETTVAVAGAAGGKAIVPVMALDVSGVHVEAKVGKQPADAALIFSGDAAVTAANTLNRTLKTDAAASGGSVGVGAALSISVLNDTASAALNRAIQANNVTVSASSISRLTSEARAGAQGAAPAATPAPAGGTTPAPAPGPDQLADGGIQSGARLSNITGSRNTNQSQVSAMGNGRIKAETSEGSIQVAAGINVNVMQNNALASIGDGIMVKALPALDVGGAIRVTSINDTDAAIKANASASKAETGVGVAVAVNVVSYQNIAHIGQAALEAATLHISADIVENKSAEKASAALGQIANTLADELIS